MTSLSDPSLDCQVVSCKTCVALQSLVSLGVTLLFLGVHPSCVDGGSAYWVTPQWVGGCWGGL